MAKEYYSDYKRSAEPRHRSLPMRIFDGCMTALSFVVGATMLLTLLVPHVNPAKVAIFPILGLTAPAIYIATLVLALFWIIRWRWLQAGLLFLPILLGCFSIPLFYRPQFRRTYGEAEYDRSTFKVLTYNVRGFYDDQGQSSAGQVARLLSQLDPDIICLQEYNAALARRSADFANLLKIYSHIGSSGTPDAGPMLIMSKFPILRSDTIPSFGSSMWADVQIGDETVRIFNNHLHTTEIKSYDDEFITQRLYLTDSTRWTKIRSIVHRHRKNCVLRAGQVDSIAPVIADTRTRYLICGDFNDTPISYVYRTMARGAKDAFSECGVDYSHTYRGFFNTLRIDYVLSSDGLETRSYEVPDVTCSDHLPVVVRLQKSETNNREPK